MKSQVLEVHAPGDATVELAFRDEVTYYREPWLMVHLFSGRICGPKMPKTINETTTGGGDMEG